ncbi:hypothetical protein T06_6663 [Trichinella sp. T6]|nr:hypothetical protein T06_6663 [Trichinella sp. T6]
MSKGKPTNGLTKHSTCNCCITIELRIMLNIPDPDHEHLLDFENISRNKSHKQYHGVHCLGHTMNSFEKAFVCSIVKIPDTNITVCFVLVHFYGICQEVFGAPALYQEFVKNFSDAAQIQLKMLLAS